MYAQDKILITINTFVNIDIYGTYYEKKNFYPLFQAFLVLAKARACYRFFVHWGNKVHFLYSVLIMSFIYRTFSLIITFLYIEYPLSFIEYPP